MMATDSIGIAEIARDAGFPVAGFWNEVYEDADVFVPPYWHTIGGRPVFGRVLKVRRRLTQGGWERIDAVIETLDGVQVHELRDPTFGVYFGLPEARRG